MSNRSDQEAEIITSVMNRIGKMEIELSIRVEPAEDSGSDIVFAIDCSPSTQLVDKAQLRVTATKNFLDLLEPVRDRVSASVLFWSDKIVDHIDLTDDFEKVKAKLDNLPKISEANATDFDEAIKAAEKILVKSSRKDNPNISRGIVLISDELQDGMFKCDKNYIGKMAQGYKIYTVGIKPSYPDSKPSDLKVLKEMANLTGGCYVGTDKPQDLNQIFRDLTRIIPYKLLTNDAKLIVRLPSNLKIPDPLDYTIKVPYDYMNKNMKSIDSMRNSDGTLKITWNLGRLVASNDPLTLILRVEPEPDSVKPEINSILAFGDTTVIETRAHLSEAAVNTVEGPIIKFSQKIHAGG